MTQHEVSGQLLDRAFLRLLPDVFFHPVWTHFVKAETPLLLEQIQSLQDAGDDLLSAGNLIEACQTFFICAFERLCAGDYDAASSNLQRILLLAEQHELPQVAWWAIWGAAAIGVRQALFEQAAGHLEHLQYLLGKQREWVLSGVLDVLRQDLLSQAEGAPADQLASPDAALSSAFDQLLHWGTPCAANAINADGLLGVGGRAGHSGTSPSSTTGFTWRSLWQTIKRIVKGELRLKWVEAAEPAPLRHPEKPRALIPASPNIAAALPPAPMLSSLDQLSISAPDQRPADIPPLASDRPELSAKTPAPPSITAHLLGSFSFSVNDATVHSWPTGKGRAVFKYMLAHHEQPIPRDVLMDVFWPQAGPEAARNSLNVALHGLRQALKTVTDMPVVLFEEGAYCINPEFHIWIDVDEFDRYVQAGRRLEANGKVAKAAAEYEDAIGLYQGDFLAGDPYEDWPVLTRERLRVAYLDVLDHLVQIHFNRDQYAGCISLCQLVLTRDTCREDIHCLLMRCYNRQGQRHLALRQYQICVEALRKELEVDPTSDTTRLYEQIRRHERV